MNQYSRLSEFYESSRVGNELYYAIFSLSLTRLNWGLHLKYYEQQIYEMGIVKEHLKLQKDEKIGINFKFGISVASLELEGAHEPLTRLYIGEFAGSEKKPGLKKAYRKTTPTKGGGPR